MPINAGVLYPINTRSLTRYRTGFHPRPHESGDCPARDSHDARNDDGIGLRHRRYFFVSKLGADAVATLGITEAIITLLYAVAIGLSMAVTALVARRIGEHNPEGAAIVAGQSLWIGVILSLIISIAGVVYAEDLLRLMGASSSAIADHGAYTSIMFGGCGTHQYTSVTICFL